MIRLIGLLALSLCIAPVLRAQSQFGEQNVLTSHDGPRDAHFSDIDGDGDLDVVAAFRNSDEILWYENDGTGNYSAEQVIQSDIESVEALQLADYDNDGDIDIFFYTYRDSEAEIGFLKNNGGVQYSLEPIIETEVYGNAHYNSGLAMRFSLADLDGDGMLDVITADRLLGAVIWYRQLPNHSFSTRIELPTGSSPSGVSVSDLDNDGDIDIAISTVSSDEPLSYFENLGNGNFDTPTVLEVDPFNAQLIRIADVDQDGDQDIFLCDDFAIRLYENLGDLNFTSGAGVPEEVVNYYYTTRDIQFNDINADGLLDIIIVGGEGDFLYWLRNTGNNIFEEVFLYVEDDYSSISLGDYNNDGDNDLLCSGASKDAVFIHESNGFQIDENGNPLSITSSNANKLCIYDFDGDGDLDLAYAENENWSTPIYYVENLGNQQFGSKQFLDDVWDNEELTPADLNDDGLVDILASNGGGSVSWFQNLGDGAFSNEIVISTDINYVEETEIVDLDGDGLLDLFVVAEYFDQGDENVAWFRNEGAGQFADPVYFSYGNTTLFSSDTYDIDSDGNLDIFTYSNGSGIHVHMNLGDGNIAESDLLFTIPGNNYYNAKLFVEDFSGNGFGDILIIDQSGGIQLYENQGDLTFSSAIQVVPESENVAHLEAFDVDNDGDLDLTYGNFYTVNWVENLGAGLFAPAEMIAKNVHSVSDLAFGDLDEDGDLDLFSASNYDDKYAWYPNLNGEGCMDPEACNYDPEAFIPADFCCYGTCGCFNAFASNYNPEATCDGGACQYPVSAVVFNDDNGNGVWDNTPQEYALANQEIVLEPMGWTVFTNDDGEVNFGAVEGVSVSLEFIPNEQFPFATVANPYVIVLGEDPSENIFIGVTKELPLHAICVDFYPPGNGYPCNDWVNHNICFRNEGNVPVDGYVEVEYNAYFQDYMEVTPIDSVVNNRIYMGFENLLPGQMFFYDVKLLSPNVEFIGEFIASYARVYGFNEGDALVAEGEQELTLEMTCAYDPNDKQVFPNGYAEPHFILNDTQLEYLIRFQNTGNAPATHVLITDTMDVNLDLSTFSLMANSHSVATTIKHEERVIEFFFENIFLPDSTNNEPESHGMVSYHITPYTDLEPGTELNNTGNIYFDNNPPIITNTTWNTIYECTQALATTEPHTEEICEGEMVEMENIQPYIETYEWMLDGEILGTEALLNIPFGEGSNMVLLNVSNPLCEASQITEVVAYENPIVIASPDQQICFGDEATFVAFSGEMINWQDLGQGGQQTVSPLETTEYIAFVENGFGCTSTDTVEVVVNSLPSLSLFDLEICEGEEGILEATSDGTVQWEGEPEGNELIVSPNSTTSYSVSATSDEGCQTNGEATVTVNPLPETTFDIVGNLLTAPFAFTYQWYLNGNVIEGATNQTLEITEDGEYAVELVNEFGCEAIGNPSFVMYVGIDEAGELSLLLYPNPTSGLLIIELPSPEIQQVEIFDSKGQLVLSDTIQGGKGNIDLTGFANGVYTVKAGLIQSQLVVRNGD